MKQVIFSLSLVILVCIGGNSQVQADELQQLIGQVTDENKGGAERADALDNLANIDPVRAEQLASDLVQDSALPVALTATRLLADSIVMSNHPITNQQHLTERQKALMKRHMKSREALYRALDDTREQVRNIAAKVLTALSDERALKSIESGVKTGLFKDIEAVNYYGLAKAKTGERYMRQYLEKGSVAARQAVIQYLGRNSAYQLAVRTKILLNNKQDPKVRTTAAKILGAYDVKFTSYVDDLVSSTSLPEEVYSEIVKQYLEKKKNISQHKIKSIKQTMDKYIEKGGIKGSLRKLKNRVIELQH